MKKQAVLTQAQKDAILAGLEAVTATFKVFAESEIVAVSQPQLFNKTAVELLETYKTFINNFPYAWRKMNRPEAPGYLASAQACQKNFENLIKLNDYLLAIKLCVPPQSKVNPYGLLYSVWANHVWALKTFVGIGTEKAEAYASVYRPISEMLYNNFQVLRKS